MKIKINDIDVNYKQYGEGKDILLLHGWGQNIEMMKSLGDNFSHRFRITIFDFPGFGESSALSNAWTIDDYANMLEIFIKELRMEKCILLNTIQHIIQI